MLPPPPSTPHQSVTAYAAPNPWHAVPYEGSLRKRAFERGIAYRMAGLRCVHFLYRPRYLQEEFLRGYNSVSLFDEVMAAGVARHGGLTWYLANRAAISAAASALGHTGGKLGNGPVQVGGVTLYAYEEPLRSLISLVVLRVLDAVNTPISTNKDSRDHATFDSRTGI